MKKNLQLTSEKFLSLFAIIEKHNISRESFIKLFKLDPSIFNNSGYKLSLDLMHKMLQKAVELTGDDLIGLRMGEHVPKLSNIIWYMMMNCATLYEASNKYYKYQKIIDDSVFMQLIEEDSIIKIKATIMDNSLKKDPQLSGAIISSIIHFSSQLTGKKIKPQKVCFSQKQPQSISEYKAILQCPIEFDADANYVIIDRKTAETPIIRPNQELLHVFQNHAQEILEKITIEETYSKRVSRLIMEMLNGGIPAIDTIAKRLASSTRNIQIKLKEEGTTYTALLNDIRKEQAIYHLRENKLSIAEISYLLGFSEPSVFHRKFKQWTGFTPKRFRTNLQGS